MGDQRADEVAAELTAVAAEVEALARSCTPEQWATVVPGEEWPVGVVVHHIAEGYDLGRSWVTALSRGEAVTITAEGIDEANAVHADQQRDVTPEQAVADLRRACADLVAALGALDAAAWEASGPFGPAGGRPVTAGDIAAVSVRHARGHLESARAALG